MRILIVNQYFPPDAANSAYVLGELAEDLAAVHDVRVIAGRPSYDFQASTFRPAGVRVIRVRSATFPRQTLAGRALTYGTFLLGATAQSLRGPRPDLIVTMTDPPFAGLIGALVGGRFRCPFVLLLHDVYPDIAVALGVLRRPRVVSAWRQLNEVIRRAADRIVVVGRDMAEKLEQEGVPRARLAYIPTWSPDFELSAEQRSEARLALGWDSRFVVMHAGNQGLAQNVEIFARLAQELREHAEIEIVILGDGAGLAGLRRSAEQLGLPNLTLIPPRPKAQAQRLMAAADLHVVTLMPGLWGCAAPSKTYGIMAAGRPFVAAVDVGSEPDLIQRDFACGERVPPGDSRALAEAILRLRDAPLDVLGRRAYEGFREHFRRERVTHATRRLFEDVVDEASKQGPDG